MIITFSNTKTAEAYEALTEYDQWVDIPVQAGNCGCTNYTGMLSAITPCAAERYINYGGNLIAKKIIPPAIAESVENAADEIVNSEEKTEDVVSFSSGEGRKDEVSLTKTNKKIKL